MRFEWDPEKAALNLEVHNIALGDDLIRLISARKANRHERQAYWESLGE